MCNIRGKDAAQKRSPTGVQHLSVLMLLCIHYPQVKPELTIVLLLRSNDKIIREFLNRALIFLYVSDFHLNVLLSNGVIKIKS